MATLEEILDEASVNDYNIPEAAIVAYYENQPHYFAGEDAADICRQAEDNYLGEYTPAEYAEQYLEDTDQLRGLGLLAQYFDYSAYGRDLVLGGDIYEIDGYIFLG